MTSPEVEVSTATAQAMVSQANRLGLVWNLVPGTMDVEDRVLLDGDQGNQSIDALSLIGNQLSGTRVMCIQIVTGGLYIIGTFATTPPIGIVIAKLRRAAAQAFASSGTANDVIFDTVDYDPYVGWNASSPTQWVAPFDGWYHVDCRIPWATNATSRRAAFVDVNTSTATVCGASIQAAGAGTTQCGGSGNIELVIGDILTLRGIQNSGGSLSTATNDNGCQMDVMWIGPSR